MALTYGAPASRGIQVGWVHGGSGFEPPSLRGFAPEVVPELVHGDETIEPVDAAVEVQECVEGVKVLGGCWFR